MTVVVIEVVVVARHTKIFNDNLVVRLTFMAEYDCSTMQIRNMKSPVHAAMVDHVPDDWHVMLRGLVRSCPLDTLLQMNPLRHTTE